MSRPLGIIDDCEGCQALRADYLNDQGVLEPYWNEQMRWTAAHLPIRGWAGGLAEAEREYLRHHMPLWYERALAKNPHLAVTRARELASTAADGQSGHLSLEASEAPRCQANRA